MLIKMSNHRVCISYLQLFPRPLAIFSCFSSLFVHAGEVSQAGVDLAFDTASANASSAAGNGLTDQSIAKRSHRTEAISAQASLPPVDQAKGMERQTTGGQKAAINQSHERPGQSDTGGSKAGKR